MHIRGVNIEDTFAEAFPMTACRIIVTAVSEHWANVAGTVATGYANSVIGCDSEAGIEAFLRPEETPDGRPGVSLLFFGFSRDALQKAVVNRVGQSIMTCPTTACFSGLPNGEKSLMIGGMLRYFGDGHQISKWFNGERYWRIPVMDGEFICQESIGSTKGVGGGNLLILGRSPSAALTAAEKAVSAIRELRNIILPFPGGIVRSGSKVGSKYKKLRASTNDSYCPTLRDRSQSVLGQDVNSVYEIVIDGLSETDVARAMQVGIMAACEPGVVSISAGNYGGTLGPVHLHLHQILNSAQP